MIIGPTKDEDRRKTEFNILLVEDSTIDALLIKTQIEKFTDFSLQQVETLSQALECLSSKQFDVILLDLNLPDALGLEALIKIRRYIKTVPIVVLTAVDDKELGIMALQRGAQDYLIKSAGNNRLMESIRYAIERMLASDPETAMVSPHYFDDKQFHPQSGATSVMENNRKTTENQILTERELQVLKLLGKGCSNQEIADRLLISLTTVKTHMSSILQKLQVSDRTNAVIQAQNRGLI